MKKTSIQKTARGKILKIAMVEQYPNDEIKLIPLTIAPDVKLIIFDPDAIKSRLKELTTGLEVWTTNNWKNNPAILIEQTDGAIILYCKYSGHEHNRGDCKARGTVVYPKGYEFDSGTTETIHL